MKTILTLVLLVTLNACATKEKPVEVTPAVAAEVKKEKVIAYDGNCGMGLCYKKMVKGNPKYFVEYKDKVYYFSSAKAQKDFSANLDKNIQTADKRWQALGGGDQKK